MPNLIDNAGQSRFAKVFWQREPDSRWEGGLVAQSTAEARRTIQDAIAAGKAPKHAYKLEPANSPHPMSQESKAALRERQKEVTA